MNRKNYELIFLCLIFTGLFLPWVGCGPSDGPNLTLSYDHPRGNPLIYNFTANWNGLDSPTYYIFLKILPGPFPSSYQDWYVISTNGNSSGNGTVTYSFPDVNPSPTDYTVRGEIRTSNYSPYQVKTQSMSFSITVNYHKFNIIQLAMTNDDLWPNYTSQNYYGYKQRDAAFGDANIEIAIDNVHSKTGLSNSIDAFGQSLDLSSDDKVFRYAVSEAYGTAMSGVDPKFEILCSVDDVPITYQSNPPNGITGGITLQVADHSTPPVSFILCNRIRGFYSDAYQRARYLTGAAIHELGHSIGITGDDINPNAPLTPPHSGNNRSSCLMITPNYPDTFTNPVFCQGHINFISQQIWFWEEN